MEKLVYTLKEFQEAHRIGHSKFYELRKKGLAPRIVDLDGKKLIYGTEAARWREMMQERSEARKCADV